MVTVTHHISCGSIPQHSVSPKPHYCLIKLQNFGLLCCFTQRLRCFFFPFSEPHCPHPLIFFYLCRLAYLPLFVRVCLFLLPRLSVYKRHSFIRAAQKSKCGEMLGACALSAICCRLLLKPIIGKI